MIKQFGDKSSMKVPSIQKIVLNMGLARPPEKRALDKAVAECRRSPAEARDHQARKAIAASRPRGLPIGCMGTRARENVRVPRRLISIALPRVREFAVVGKGLSGRELNMASRNRHLQRSSTTDRRAAGMTARSDDREDRRRAKALSPHSSSVQGLRRLSKLSLINALRSARSCLKSRSGVRRWTQSSPTRSRRRAKSGAAEAAAAPATRPTRVRNAVR